jgi:hypothetical protein
MGCMYELNDTLLLSPDQGFPTHVFDYKSHVKNPVTLKDVEGKIFDFKNKPAARAFQLDPVRVFFFENVPGEKPGDSKWLAWGKVLIQSLHIVHNKDITIDPDNPIKFESKDWLTSGTYKILEVYDPEYQRIFTSHEAPAAWNFFGK